MQQALVNELKRAQGSRLVTELITVDSRVFPGIIVESHAEGVISGFDSEHAHLTISEDIVSGVIVKTDSPQWANQHEH